jgi:pimeloyl-ACP methyl ester carboxylesterase
MSNSAIIFVPGAWHSPDGYDKVIALLSARGFTNRKIHLASIGRSPPVTSIEPDVEAIRAAALVEMQQGHDVTVVCHSYGGLPTSEALEGLDKRQTVGGGRVLAIVYIAALVMSEGVSLNAALVARGENRTEEYLDLLSDGNIFFKKESNPGEVFYSDLSAEDSAYWVTQLKPHAPSTFDTPGKYAAWKDIPSWYLVCRQDIAMPPDVQRAFVQEARKYLDQVGGLGTGQQRMRSQEIDASHSPFLSRPEETAAFIESAAMANSMANSL